MAKNGGSSFLARSLYLALALFYPLLPASCSKQFTRSRLSLCNSNSSNCNCNHWLARTAHVIRLKSLPLVNVASTSARAQPIDTCKARQALYYQLAVAPLALLLLQFFLYLANTASIGASSLSICAAELATLCQPASRSVCQ